MEEQTVVTLEHPGYPIEVLARLSSRDAAEAWYQLHPEVEALGLFQFIRFRYPFQVSASVCQERGPEMIRPEYASEENDRAERKAAYDAGYQFEGKRSTALIHATKTYDHILAHNFMRGWVARKQGF